MSKCAKWRFFDFVLNITIEIYVCEFIEFSHETSEQIGPDA